MQVCVRTVTLPCLCFCTYKLPLIKIYFSAKSCLMSFVKLSHAFKLNSVLNSSATVCLDKAVYFTLEQTEKLSHSLRFVRKGIAATKHVDQNKESDTEIY